MGKVSDKEIASSGSDSAINEQVSQKGMSMENYLKGNAEGEKKDSKQNALLNMAQFLKNKQEEGQIGSGMADSTAH